MRFQNALENARLALKISVSACLLAWVLNILLIIGWYQAQTEVSVYLPPQIPAAGISLKAESYPPTSIFSFAYYIWQSLNYWPVNGADDYKHHIEQFTPFITPRFKEFLNKNYNERLNQGELQERIRSLSGINGMVFDQADVALVSAGVWHVHLHMHLREYFNGNEVKNTPIEYSLRVIHQDSDIRANPWGLMMDGFVTPPLRQAFSKN